MERICDESYFWEANYLIDWWKFAGKFCMEDNIVILNKKCSDYTN